MPEGLHVLRLKAGCRARGKGWVISGILRRTSNISLSLPLVPAPAVALPSLLDAGVLKAHLASPTWKALGRIADISLSKLPDKPSTFIVPRWGSHPRHIAWGAATTTFVLIIIIFIIAIKFRFRIAAVLY